MKRKLIVVDTETGGLDPAVDAIVSFAAVIYQDGSIVGTFHSLVHDAEGRSEEEATRVHGIAPTELVAAPTPFVVAQQFKNWLLANEVYGKQTLCAHNAAFDSAFLRRLWRLAGEDFDEQFHYRMLCTQTAALLLEQAGRINLPGGSASLDNVSAVFGLKRASDKHGALEDAILTAKVLAKMVERLK